MWLDSDRRLMGGKMRRSSVLALFVLVFSLMFALPPMRAEANHGGSLNGTPLSSWQTNAQVRALAYVNGVVYLGGDFTSVRPPGSAAGTNEVARSYLAAFSASTGQLLTSFDHALNGSVQALAVSPDGSRLYAAGEFRSVDGQSRPSLAAFATATGALSGTWTPSLDRISDRMALATSGDRVYVGGNYQQVNGQNQPRLAAVTADTGTLLPWTPTVDNGVYAIVVASGGTKMFIGGSFRTVNGAAHHAIASLSASDASLLPFPAESAVPPITASCESSVLDITLDATTVYVANGGSGTGCFDGTFAAALSDGTLTWRSDCLGATEAIELVGGVLYKGSHAHDCSRVTADPDAFPEMGTAGWRNFQNGQNLLAQDPGTGNLLSFYADTDGHPVGPKALASDGQQLFVGGDFEKVGSLAQQGFTRFGGADTTKPTYPSGLKVASVKPGTIKVTVTTSLDDDDTDLTYNLYRDNGATPIATTVAHSLYWRQPRISFQDSGLAAGSSHFYQVEVSDGPNRVRTPFSATVTVASANGVYDAQAKADVPYLYWRLGEGAGSTVAADASGNGNTGSIQSGVTLGVAGAVAGDTAADFNGTSGLVTATSVTPTNQQTVSVEAWFKTTTTTGGKLVGYGNFQTGTSTSYDRHLYMANSGRLLFGVANKWLGNTTISSPASYNDGQWHHVVATLGRGGMVLYVDGTQVAASTASLPALGGFRGYWRVGGDSLSGWPSRPTSDYFKGTIDEVAVYPGVLSAGQVADHYTSRTSGLPTQSGQTTVGVAADSYIDQNFPTTNYGTANPIKATSSVRRALFRFDTSAAVPAGNVVTGATLRIYATRQDQPSGAFEAHPLADGWTETGVTWNTAPPWDPIVLGTSSQSGANVYYEMALPASAINTAGNSNFGVRGTVANMEGEITSDDAPTNKAQLVVSYGPTS
jgi:Concanavalin A-like lectin/glucanases superfamily